MSTKVCLVLTEKTIEKNLSALEKYKKLIDIAELRVDYLNQSEILYLRNFPERAGIPCILTVRRKSDGGNFMGGEGARMTIFARGLAFASTNPIKNFSYIDLESDFDSSGIEEAARAFDIKIIRSLHAKSPVKNIVKTLEGLRRFETDIPKFAFRANSLNDVSELFKASKLIENQEYIVSVMGPYGVASRILSKKLNSQIVYTFTHEYIKKNKLEQELIDPEKLEDLYGFSKIDNATTIYGVIGKDVNTSLSPKIHNTGFKRKNLNSVYLPISAVSPKDALDFANLLNIKGLSVTAPFKGEIIPLVNSISEASKFIGAVNTLVNENKKWFGYNTDVDGFEQALIEFLNEKDLRRYKVAIIGAGGAARAVAQVVKALHGKACIFNRTAEKAQNIAEKYNFKWALLDPINIKQLYNFSELIIQTTNAGMEPNLDVDPLSFYTFTGKEKVFELIYRPETTKLLKRARTAGCRVCNGYKMLEYQAYHQFKAFAGKEYL
ncbi:type I 3-dehydroquinate dehydratase [Treponema sp. OMZ 788]|uniref:type I 3-dehydroquinate dehydratase n=1 Tax=Treponema sp. OMZ 788 TaxID=2563664 RepID=UPI0020A32E03|nr:type I 3-dehydroquinate dehydratase [Treponema sp. OMZ 788]UTC65582.1 type I 3-dehydroquinate dehydratase [Treponema sp. OMZ 788]